jgi:CBS domain-containing protein
MVDVFDSSCFAIFPSLPAPSGTGIAIQGDARLVRFSRHGRRCRMKTPHKPLYALTAADLMSREVLTIPQGMSLQAAARMLGQDHISGAPVVDEDGRCAGVLSATDFVRWAEAGGKTEFVPSVVEAVFSSDWEVVNVEYLPREEVRWYMSPEPVTAAPTMRLTELARMMLDAHIHRIIVVDAGRRPIGVVSSTDVLAAVAYAEETPEEE